MVADHKAVFYFLISLFPKYSSSVLFWRALAEKRELYIKRVMLITALLVTAPLACFLFAILSGRLIRGLVEL
jgi:hypothetical protein